MDEKETRSASSRSASRPKTSRKKATVSAICRVGTPSQTNRFAFKLGLLCSYVLPREGYSLGQEGDSGHRMAFTNPTPDSVLIEDGWRTLLRAAHPSAVGTKTKRRACPS
jgi:hypothetical protein